MSPVLHTMTSVFLSTPSARRATHGAGGTRLGGVISIHALREEGDSSSTSRPSRAFRFLSTPSARRATAWYKAEQAPAEFLSTPSARRATLLSRARPSDYSISIHALREEGDTWITS